MLKTFSLNSDGNHPNATQNMRPWSPDEVMWRKNVFVFYFVLLSLLEESS
jgi:hypothetical protein